MVVVAVRHVAGVPTRFFSGDCGHGVHLGAGVLAIIVSNCGSSGVDPRVQVVHGVLPFCHLGHPILTHWHTKGRKLEQILLTEAPNKN